MRARRVPPHQVYENCREEIFAEALSFSDRLHTQKGQKAYLEIQSSYVYPESLSVNRFAPKAITGTLAHQYLITPPAKLDRWVRVKTPNVSGNPDVEARYLSGFIQCPEYKTTLRTVA